MPSWMAGWPVLLVLGFFLMGAIIRSQAIYWAGRGIAVGVTRGHPAPAVEDGTPGERSAPAAELQAPDTRPDRSRLVRARDRVAASLDSQQVIRARGAIERWGMPVIPVAFLTVGFQSAVFGAAGLLRIGWIGFTLWSLPGAVAWALVWGGGGMAAVAGALAVAREEPWYLVAVLAGAGVLVTLVSALVRRRRAARAGRVVVR